MVLSNDLNGVNYQDTIVNGITYRRFRFPDCYLPPETVLIGRPELPAVRVLIAVPDSAEVKIGAVGLDTITYEDIQVYPRPELRYGVDTAGLIYWYEVFKKDETFYTKDQIVPRRVARIIRDGHFRDQRVLEVLIFPVRCNPAQNKVYIHSKIVLGLRFKGVCLYDTLGLGPFENLGHDLFLNYAELRRRHPIPEGPPPPPPEVNYYDFLKNPNNRADYLIVVNDKFLDSPEPASWIDNLAHWRCDHNRYDIAVVRTSDINEEFGPPDHKPWEILREFISYVYHNWKSYHTGHVGYCLLIGDWDLVPTYLWKIVESETNKYLGARDDTIFNVIGSAWPDLAWGRIPAKVDSEVVQPLEKIYNYEHLAVIGDWRRRGYAIKGRLSWEPDSAWDEYVNQTLPLFTAIGYDTVSTRLYEWNPPAFQEDLRKKFSAGQILACYYDHGAPPGWCAYYDTMNVLEVNNNGRQMVLFSDCCMTAPFQWDHPYFENFILGRGGHCFGEHWIYPEGRGAVGFIGTTIPGGLGAVEAVKRILVDQEWIIGHSFLSIHFNGFKIAELFGDPLLDLGDYTAYPDHPDLCVRPFGRDTHLGFPYPYPREDDSIPITAAVWNIGAKDIVNQPFKIRAELTDPSGNILWSKEGWLSKLGSRDSVVLTAKLPASVLTPGIEHHLIVTADVEDVIEESWEGNNQSTLDGIKILAFYPRMTGWPKKIPSCRIPTLADLDGDGSLEIIVTLPGAFLVVFHADGTTYWSQMLTMTQSVSSPAVADLDQDGSPEVIVFAQPNLLVFKANGENYPGFPVEVPNWTPSPDYVTHFSGPSVADLDQDGDQEIVGAFFHMGVAAPPDQVFVWEHDGTLSHGFNAGQDMDISSHPVLADVDGDNLLEITVSEAILLPPFGVATDVFALSGLIWTLQFGGALVTPAVGNLTGGSEAEIVLGHWNDVICFYWTGTGFVERWRVETEGPVASSPAVADFDRVDPQLDVMFGSDDKKIHAVKGDDGTYLPEWPKQTDGRVPQSPALVRVDANEGPELLVGSDDCKVYLYTGAGDLIPPFPLPLWERPKSAVCGDIDNDGIQEAVVWSHDGYLHVWKLNPPAGQVSHPGLDWPTFHQNPARTGYYQEP